MKKFLTLIGLFFVLLCTCFFNSCKKENPFKNFELPNEVCVNDKITIKIEQDLEILFDKEGIIEVNGKELIALNQGDVIITLKSKKYEYQQSIHVYDELIVNCPSQIYCYTKEKIDVSLKSGNEVENLVVTPLDETIISVNDEYVKANKEGKTKLLIEASGCSKEVEIESILNENVLEINIPSEIIVKQYTEVSINIATIGKIKNFIVTSSDEKIVSYNSSLEMLMGKKLGEVTLTVTYGEITKSINVKVVNNLVLEVPNIIRVFDICQITCSTALNQKLTIENLTSSNPEILQINSIYEIEAKKSGKVTLTLEVDDLKKSIEIEVLPGYQFTYQNNILPNHTTTIKVYDENNLEIEDFILQSLTENIQIDKHLIKGVSEGEGKFSFSYQDVTYELSINVLSLVVEGLDTMKRGGMQKLKIGFIPETYEEDYVITASEDSLVEINQNTIKALKPGTVTLTITTLSGLEQTFTINITDVYYQIIFNLTLEEEQLLPTEIRENYQQFSIDDLPIALPTMERESYSFLGWELNNNGQNIENLVLEIAEGTNYNVKLTPVWGYSHIELYHQDVQVIEPNQTLNLIAKFFMIPSYVDQTKLTWKSFNDEVATVEDGVVTGISDGFTLISVCLTEKPNINTTIGVTIMNGLEEMDELLQYFIDNAIPEVIAKEITVTGYQFIYSHQLLGSVTKYLFMEYSINNDYFPVPMTAGNRPGEVYPNYYIVVHDTASSDSSANALAHAKYVYGGAGEEKTSWHYSVGNDGIYHQIPDNENAKHAGDGGRPYKLTKTDIQGTKKNPTVTISTDGYYEIDGQKTKVLAPTDDGKILDSSYINDCGIRVILEDGYYYIGDTYYNTTYHKISNTGGNRNSIGMETMVNKGSDLYLTWQKTAQLVAHLMKYNKLTIDDVKPHHYFSGKNCPQTMRDNGLWDNFLTLVSFEYDILTKFEGYTLSFESHDPEYLNEYGRIIKQDTKTKTVSYTITVTKNGVSKSITLSSNIPGSLS